MANVQTPIPDFKVFFRRLLVPGENPAAQGVIVSPSASIGAGPTTSQGPVGQQIADAFSQYEPSQFRGAVISKSTSIATTYQANLAAAQAAVDSTNKQLSDLRKQLAQVTTGNSIPLDSAQLNNLSIDSDYYASTETDAEDYASSDHGPTDITPLSRDNARFQATQANLQGISTTLGSANPAATNLISELNTILNSLVVGAFFGLSSNVPTTLTPAQEDTERAILADGLASLVNMFANQDAQAQINSLNSQIGSLDAALADQSSNLTILQKSSAVQPFYDPILLDCLIGPYAMNTSGNRFGQPGSGSVTFHLPLAPNGQVPDLFFGLQVTDVFNLSNLESQLSAATGAAQGASIPAQTLSILTANMRETTIQPFDMMQIWCKRRYATTSNFPGDYYPIFTGFVTKTHVSYEGSSIGVKIDGEDVGKVVRLARIDADPSLDTSLNALGLGISAFTNNLQAATANGQTGGQMIKNIIQGNPGSFLGLSQASFITTGAYAGSGGSQTLVTVPVASSATSSANPVATNSPTSPVTEINTSLVNLAWDFQKIQVNVFDDLINNFPVYALQLRTAFRTWQTDELTKWEVCAQIAETQEFEFYADNLGVINYHPPLYYLNPFAPQYYIEDVDIKSEAHTTDEAQVVTVMELDTQPSFFANGSAIDPIIQGRSFVSTATPVMQRYGVRYNKKSSPVFSDTTIPSNPGQKQSGDSTYTASDLGRMGYARALINRRNSRLKSATVTINGTPELRLCNTVAFVGDIAGALQNVSTNPFSLSASPGATTQLNSTLAALLGVQSTSVPAAQLTLLQQMLVYYISGITHSWMQGKDFTTTLTLTHGRHWTDALPSGSVGFGVSGPQTDQVYQTMLNFYGQGDANLNASNFVQVAAAKLSFIAGTTNSLTPTTNSQFGFTYTPVRPSLLQRFETKLATAVNSALLRLRAAICHPLHSENDPKQGQRTVSDELKNIENSISDALSKAAKQIEQIPQKIENIFKNLENKGEKMIATYENKLETALKQAALQIEDLLNNPEALAFQALLGSKSFKIINHETFSSGEALNLTGAQTYLAPLKNIGVNPTAITSFGFGIGAYIYVASSSTSVAQAKTTAETQVLAAAKSDPNLKQVKGQPKKLLSVVLTSTTAMRHTTGGLIPTIPPPPNPASLLSGSSLSSLTATPSTVSSTVTATANQSAPQQTYYILGMVFVGINPIC